VDLRKVGELCEGWVVLAIRTSQVVDIVLTVLVSERNVDEAVVGEGAHGSKSSGLLSSTLGAGGDEETSILAPVRSLGPLLASLVPEGLPLSGEVAVTCRYSKEDTIVLLKNGGVREGFDVGGLGWCVHFGEDFLGEGLSNPEAR
jgi:hypothetical protein